MLAQRTPFHSSMHQKNVSLKDGGAGLEAADGKPVIILNTRPAMRPLGDKTPFPNRVNIATQDTIQKETLQRLPKLLESFYPSINNQEGSPELSRRPSSTRKNGRTPRGGRGYQTPMNKGNPWDVSDGSIELGETQVQAQAEEDVEFSDTDEIEYMPPNTLDLPYQPPFDFELPNYTDVGKTLFNFTHSYPFDDAPPPESEPDLSDFVANWDLLPSHPQYKSPSEDPDDPFHVGEAVSTLPNRSGVSASRRKSSRTTSSSSIATRTTRVPSNSSATTATTTTRTGTSRPATAAGVSRPVTRSMTKSSQTGETKRPASAAATMAASRQTAKAFDSTTRTGQVKKLGSGASNGLSPGSLRGIVEDHDGESSGIVLQQTREPELDDFLFDV
ncbi:hypothetical protein AMATHDRAFT_54079 [Amanita thiersii Skay4041]|uniref:Uncharacterized protein n=1 Tax=Amanita thiersii Skay4041 TaxID=703135 RepID=A0A2A9NZU0_9AGAR|nr:hypothetical protein AMATHDRAFT_54079 [Amanita thiersii Skay4041]